MNPYQEWLGRYDLSENSHPNHYDLLGLPLFESSTSRIEQTANQLLEKVRSVRPGANMPAWSRLISDIQAARDCLCNHHSKREYDKTLPKSQGSYGNHSSDAPIASGYGQIKDYGTESSFGSNASVALPPGVGGKTQTPSGSYSTPNSYSSPSSYSTSNSYSSPNSSFSSSDSDNTPNLNAIPPSPSPLASSLGSPLSNPANPKPAISDPLMGNPPLSTPGYPPGYQPIPGQPIPGYGYPPGYSQPIPGQPIPGQPIPGQPIPGYGYPPGYPQPIPGQPIPGYGYPPGYPQPIPGQPIPGYGYPPGYPQPSAGYPVDPNNSVPPGYSAYPNASQPIPSAQPVVPQPIPSAQPVSQAPAPSAPVSSPSNAPLNTDNPFANSASSSGNAPFQSGSSPKTTARRRFYKPAGRPAIYQYALNAACIIGLGIIVLLGYEVMKRLNQNMNEEISPDIIAEGSKVNDTKNPVSTDPAKDDKSGNTGENLDEKAGSAALTDVPDSSPNSDGGKESEAGKENPAGAAKDGDANKGDNPNGSEAGKSQDNSTSPATDPSASAANNSETNNIEFSISSGNESAADPGKADSSKSGAFRAATTEIRAGLAEMDPGYARGKFAEAEASAQTQQDKDELARLKALTDRIEQYLTWIVTVMTSSDIEEMQIDGEPVSIIEMNAKGISVRARGQNRDYGLQQLPPKFVEFITKSSVAKSPVNKALLGSYLAMNPKGNRARAKQLWLEATKGGEDCTILMPELDVPPVKMTGAQPTGGAAATGAGNSRKNDSGRKTVDVPTSTFSVPDEQNKTQALAKVKLAFATGYASDAPKNKETLSERLLSSTSDVKYAPEEKFVMLEEAARLAKEVDRPGIAYDAIEMRGKLFQQDTYQERLDLILAAKPDVRGRVSQKDVAESAERLLTEAMQAKKTADAEKLVPILKSSASKSGRVQLIRTAMDAERALKSAPTQKPATPNATPNATPTPNAAPNATPTPNAQQPAQPPATPNAPNAKK